MPKRFRITEFTDVNGDLWYKVGRYYYPFFNSEILRNTDLFKKRWSACASFSSVVPTCLENLQPTGRIWYATKENTHA